jgi:hypothetical protein
LNTDPYRFYEDAEGEPTHHSFRDSIQDMWIADGETYTEPVILSEGGIMYYLYTFDDLVDRVRIDLTGVQKSESNQNGVQLVYRARGRWYYDDVSYRDEVVFCRSRETEDVDAVIVVVSNGILDSTDSNAILSADMVIDTTEVCVRSWHGYVECSWSTGGEVTGRSSDTWMLGNYTSEGTKRFEETLIYDYDNHRFYAVEQTASICAHYERFYEHVVSSVDTSYIAWEQRVEDKSASQTFTYEIPENCPPDECWDLPTRIRGTDDEAIYEPREQTISDVGTYVSVYCAYHIPGALGLMQGHVPEARTLEDEHDINVTCPSEMFELTMSEDGLRLTGSYRTESQAARPSTLTTESVAFCADDYGPPAAA